MRSIRLFFRQEVKRKEQIVAQELTPADEEAEFQRCSSINDQWNLEIAKIRNERLAKENAERAEFIKSRLEAKKIRDEENLRKVDAIVKREKELAPTFVTRDNIDEAIEKALANPSDYNFSIDLQGAIYKGSERPGKATKPEEEAS
jgi:small subunit ribosomal protein S26